MVELSIRPAKPRPEILLHHNIPKPLHGIAPRVILGDDWWKNAKAEAKQKAFDHCMACGRERSTFEMHKWLECHEMYEIDYAAGTATFVEVVAICPYCHKYIHSGLLEIMLAKGEIDPITYEAIIEHGDNVLWKVGLVKEPVDLSSGMAKWEYWRMIIEGKEYMGKFKDFNHWLNFYRGE